MSTNIENMVREFVNTIVDKNTDLETYKKLIDEITNCLHKKLNKSERDQYSLDCVNISRSTPIIASLNTHDIMKECSEKEEVDKPKTKIQNIDEFQQRMIDNVYKKYSHHCRRTLKGSPDRLFKNKSDAFIVAEDSVENENTEIYVKVFYKNDEQLHIDQIKSCLLDHITKTNENSGYLFLYINKYMKLDWDEIWEQYILQYSVSLRYDIDSVYNDKLFNSVVELIYDECIVGV